MLGRRRRLPRYLRRWSTLPSAPAAPWSASVCRTRSGICGRTPAMAGRANSRLFETGPRVPDMPQEKATRLLVAPRAELRPLYLNSPKLRVGKSGGVLRIKERDKVVQDARINEICQVNLMGAVQISTQAVQELCRAEKPICYFSQGGWFYGVTTGLGTKNVFLRRSQFRLAEEEWFCLRLARRLVVGQDPQPADDAAAESHRAAGVGHARVEASWSGARRRRTRWTNCWAWRVGRRRIYFGLFAGMVKRERDGEVSRRECRSTSRRGIGDRRATR